MSYGSTYATFACLGVVCGLGFFLFGNSTDSVWCYAVGSVCLLPTVGAIFYACYYECKMNSMRYPPERKSKPAPKPKRTGAPKAKKQPQQQEEQMPTAPPALELREVVISN
jgi:hypothetical protein